MTDQTEFVNRSYQYENIQDDILIKLEKSRQQFPERFPKPVYVMPTVDDNIDGQWEQRLIQAKQDQVGERVTLIPYNLGSSHWIGVLLKFTSDEQIEWAEFIDPVKESNFLPDKLQKQFVKVYPDAILRSGIYQKHNDQKQSAVLTIENLLQAAEKALLTNLGYPNKNDLHSQIVGDHKTNTDLTEDEQLNWQQEERNILRSASTQGNNSTLCQLEQTLKNALERLKIRDISKVSEKVQRTEERVEEYEQEQRTEEAKRERKFLNELRMVQELLKEIDTVKSAVSNYKNHIESEFFHLQQKMESDLVRLRIQDVSKLPEITQRTQQRIKEYEEDDRTEEAETEMKILVELRLLQECINRIHNLKCDESIYKDDDQLKLLKPYEVFDRQLKNDRLDDNSSERFQMKEVADVDSYQGEECPTTEEDLKNMSKDVSSMPLCSDRCVISLLYHISLMSVSNTIVLDQNAVVSDRIDIEKECECLKERLIIEELESSEIQNSIEDVFINIKGEKWKHALISLRKIFKEICPLNMEEMFRLVDKVDNTAQLIKNKDIIFFLGGTGSGKSTAIHFLAGSKMIEKKVKGLNHIAPDVIKNPDLKNITTSPFARSETRYITPVVVNFEDVGGYNSGSIILCDSPGFEDTNGAEVDIANGIGIVKAIKGCKSVKPVVLISYKSIGDRSEGVKNLAHVLAGLIPEIRDQIKAFSYLFTKYPPNERTTIHASLDNIRKTMNDEEKSDISFMNLFKDMLHKTEDGARCIDPVYDKPRKILDELAESTAIHRPEEVFQFSITEKSKSIVQEQVRKLQFSILSATKRSEYSLVKYRLDQLKRLNDLLELDYIKQFYNNCVQFISRHLFEEYEEGTSALKCCLMNQTVLNNEDIQEYQTCIDHAKLAGELGSEHLGKEVTHSSIFIQYLNQQVDSILDDLREKDIDDLAVKTSLDKIKLLSNSFLDVDCKYKNACQSLNEKFESVIKSFEHLVLCNEFDKSASNITKLYGALTVLQGHIKRDDMEAKYAELKAYFLNYLHDSMGKISHIFSQEKVGRNDVDSLNSCVCMLEIANNTYTLHSHVSKKAINEVYENLVSKILNHVEEIINKINTQLKHENSFDILEQYMEEFDSIRTISIIELKTAQSYFSTLEKLVGYVHESRRDVDALLRTLFRREGKVNYDKLTKGLSSLKSAQWIEKYRTGVYSDVINNVEEQMIKHVKDLKESVIEVNLDLDNFDKIEHVYKIISEINEIKHFEKTVTGVSQYIEEVNSWFEGGINSVFIIIRDTFSVEKCKEHNYQTLDFNKADKAFHYLDACRKIRVFLKNDCICVLNSLEEFLRYFSNFIQKEMASCCESIKQSENKNKEEMFERARVLLSRLQEISEIKTKYSRIFSYFSNQKILEEWQNELSSYLVELSDEMEKLSVTQRTDTLRQKLLVAKALSKLDSFLQGEKYIDVYIKYQDKFYAKTDDVARQVIDSIKNFDYEGVACKMIVLQSSSDVGEYFLEQASRALTIGLDDLMEETKNQAIMLGNNIEKEEIKPIVENLKRMQRAKQFVSQFLDTSDKIEKCVAEVKKFVEERIKRFLEGVKALITINNFYEADKKIDSILLVRTLLGSYCTEDIVKQIEELKERQSDVVLKDVVQKYSEMDINAYALNPPNDIFEKFKQVNNTNPIYNQALNTIKERIFVKFRTELEEAKSKQPPNSENIHIRRFESAVKYLPEEMRNALEVELKHCKDDITVLIRDNNNKLEKTFDSGDLKSLKNVLHEYQNSEGMQCYLNKARERVLEQVQELTWKINETFEQYDISGALNHVKKLYDYEIELGNIVDIKRSCSEIRSRIGKIFQDAYLCCTKYFSNDQISAMTNEITEAIEKSFICLMELMKFSDEFQDQSISIYMLPEDFNDKLSRLNRYICHYFNEHQKDYEKALEKLDIASLEETLNVMNQWNSLFIKIKSYDDINSNNDTLVNTFVKVIKELTPYRHMLESISQKIEELRDELINQELINNETKEFSKNRDEFYCKLYEKLYILNKAKVLTSFNIRIDLNKIEQECLKSIEKKITDIVSVVETVVGKFSEDSNLTRQDYDSFNLHYSNLISFKQGMKVAHWEINEKIKIIEKVVFDKIHTWEYSIKTEPTVENSAISLINMKRVSNNIPSFKLRINERIDDMLNRYKMTTNDAMAFAKLGTILNQDRAGIGQSIISEHKSFQGYSLSLFNEKTRRHDIKYVLDKLYGDSINKTQLRKRFEEFHNTYQSLIQQYLKPNIALDKLISDTKLIAGNIKQESERVEWDANTRYKVPKLLAHVFALWTLKNADHYFEAEDLNDKDNYLLQPHAAQVISIFRMLGIGDLVEELKNNLVQIGTGEGKSVTLGATSSLLALLGFDVYCACYSDYLSQRDYTAFLSLFDSLGLLSYIHYGTFNKLYEDKINHNGDIRQIVEQVISKGSNDAGKNNQQTKRAKILLIDEVDVFFSKEFYGNVYTPSASLRDPTITTLVNLIWTQRHKRPKLNLNSVRNTVEYKACCNRFPNWERLIQEAVKDMLSDINTFESHDYVIHQDKIGYIEQDRIIHNVLYGYKTLFAYHCEHEKGKISQESLEENISIRIKCGSFSYAEMPLEFKYIMGVTGTLKTLSNPEKQVIQNVYKIMKNTYIPSVFGENNLKFTEKDDIMIENSDNYFNIIRREIDDRLAGKLSEKRAVLVLFESKRKLKEFYNSNALTSIKESVVYLTEEASLEEKENLIKRATISGQITLFTRTFGRGTDFICRDQSVATNGGTHVIQTFLSEEFSEEVQIKGRTARQGDHGSYSMILLDQDLEKFHIEKEHIENVKRGKGILPLLTDALRITKTYDTIYDLLHDKRTDLFKIQYEANMKYVQQAKERHQVAQNFLSRLNSKDINSVHEFLVEENKGAGGNLNSRTVCLMDATGSMSHLLHNCKNTVNIMFERASEILADHNISSDTFQIQFVVYRNYNSREDKILQSSPWETKPDNLRTFMNAINAEGGMGNEAIEIGLWHANKENERENITQVILIGDAPPNSKKDVDKNRGQFGEKYWTKTKFPQPTYYEDELEKLASASIPVHAFFVESRAATSFKAIANRTGGRCEMLDINSSAGSQMLTDLVTEEILRNIGGNSRGNVLVEAYRNKFGRSYT